VLAIAFDGGVDQHAGPPRLLGHRGNESLEILPDLLGTCVRLEQIASGPRLRASVAVHRLYIQLVLVPECSVEALPPHAEVFLEVADRGALVAFGPKELDGAVEDEVGVEFAGAWHGSKVVNLDR
jgi:hypothetical protein